MRTGGLGDRRWRWPPVPPIRTHAAWPPLMAGNCRELAKQDIWVIGACPRLCDLAQRAAVSASSEARSPGPRGEDWACWRRRRFVRLSAALYVASCAQSLAETAEVTAFLGRRNAAAGIAAGSADGLPSDKSGMKIPTRQTPGWRMTAVQLTGSQGSALWPALG